MRNLNIDKFLRAFTVLFCLISIVFILKYTFIYIYPFIIAIILAVLLDPLVTKVEVKGKLTRGVATWLVLCGFVSLITIIGYFLMQQIVKELVVLIEQLPVKIQLIKDVTLSVGQTVYDKVISVFPFLKVWGLEHEIEKLMNQIGTFSIGVIKNILLTTTNTLSSLSYFAIICLFITIAVYMLAKDLALFKKYILHIVPNGLPFHAGLVISNVKKSIIGLMKAQLIITVLSTIIIGICLMFFQVEHVLSITLLMFFVDFIPYMGIGIIFIPWILFLFFTNQYVLTIELTLLYIFIIILRQMIEPKLIAREIGIHPFIALSILFIGIQTLGVLGIFITPAILVGVSALYRAGILHALFQYIDKK